MRALLGLVDKRDGSTDMTESTEDGVVEFDETTASRNLRIGLHQILDVLHHARCAMPAC